MRDDINTFYKLGKIESSKDVRKKQYVLNFAPNEGQASYQNHKTSLRERRDIVITDSHFLAFFSSKIF